MPCLHILVIGHYAQITQIASCTPIQRETYDMDLRRFEEQAQKQLAARVASFDQHQSRSDSLGAIDVARNSGTRFDTQRIQAQTVPKAATLPYDSVSHWSYDSEDGSSRCRSSDLAPAIALALAPLVEHLCTCKDCRP